MGSKDTEFWNGRPAIEFGRRKVILGLVFSKTFPSDTLLFQIQTALSLSIGQLQERFIPLVPPSGEVGKKNLLKCPYPLKWSLTTSQSNVRDECSSSLGQNKD